MFQKKETFGAKLKSLLNFSAGVVIASLAIFYGKLSQKLLADMALKDTNNIVKRDLWLIAFNITIVNENKPMLADIAEVIWKNTGRPKDPL